jgi:hypothetical protein
VILAVHLLIIFKVVIPFLARTPFNDSRHALIISLLVSPPLLALLEALIDREGPVKNWTVGFLLCMFQPALALNHDAVVVAEYLASGKPPVLWATLLLNATLIPASVIYLRKMVPRVCPGCQKRTLIPLMRLLMKDGRTTNTCWCASCGGKYWKDREGHWRVERRKTWLDSPKETPAPKVTGAPPPPFAGPVPVAARNDPPGRDANKVTPRLLTGPRDSSLHPEHTP